MLWRDVVNVVEGCCECCGGMLLKDIVDVVEGGCGC